MSGGINGTIGLIPARAKSHAHAAPGRFVIVTPHELAAAGIEALLQAGGHRVLDRLTPGDDLLRSLESNRPDTLFLNMVRREAVRLIAQLRADHHSMSIILMLEERDMITAASLLELDVEGILLGEACSSSVLHCVENVRHGRRWVDPDLLRHLASAERTARLSLTTREGDIANLVAHGLHNKEIARELRLSEGTVKMHLHHIYENLRIRSRTELALLVTRNGGPGLGAGPD